MALRKSNDAKKEETKVEAPQKEAEAVEPKASEPKKEDKKVTVEVKKEEPKTQPNVRINPNTSIRTYIGNQWYSITKGKQISVPQNVKETLARAGYLDPL